MARMEIPDFKILMLNQICPECGKINCPVMANNASYKQIQEALLKGELQKAQRIFMQKFSQYTKRNAETLNTAVNERLSNKQWNGVPYDSIDLLNHYLNNSGEDIQLTNIGLSNRVRYLVIKDGAFGKQGSIQSRFIEQFKNGERSEFSNVYDFTKEATGIKDPLWAIGSATIKGKMSNLKLLSNNEASIDITYELVDKFTDPYDIFNWTSSEWNPNGKPFYIKDRWTGTVNFKYKPMTEHQLMRLLQGKK